jgi:ribosomal protein L37AE/L43A
MQTVVRKTAKKPRGISIGSWLISFARICPVCGEDERISKERGTYICHICGDYFFGGKILFIRFARKSS